MNAGFSRAFLVALALFASTLLHADDDQTAKLKRPALMPPAVSTGTGLLLEPALTLPEFTREKFIAAMNTVGPEKIHKQ